MGAKDFENAAVETREDTEGSYDSNFVSDDDKLDLRQEVFQQIRLLKKIREHLFAADGRLKIGTEFKDVRSYMSSSTQLLPMLQKFEEALKTDADFAKVELALENAMAEIPSPEFVKLLKYHLAGEPQDEKIYSQG